MILGLMPTEDTIEKPTGKVLLEWRSPARVFIPKDKKYVQTVILFLLFVGLVTVFFQQWLLYAVFLSLGFVSYVLRSVPPEEIDHKATEFGLTSGNHHYSWRELKDFWFTQKGGFDILNIDTSLRFPPRLFLLIGGAEKKSTREKLIQTLSPHLPYRELPQENFVDKLFDNLSQRFNLS